MASVILKKQLFDVLGYILRENALRFLKIFLIMCMNSLTSYISVHYAHAWYPLMSRRGIRSIEIGIRDAWATMWVLGIEPRSSARVTHALKYWAISSDPSMILLNYKNLTAITKLKIAGEAREMT